MNASIFLVDPKIPHNVGGALRACYIFGARELAWSGTRVKDRRTVAKSSRRESPKHFRLPREERMRKYDDVAWGRDPEALNRMIDSGLTPVCVEVLENAESLWDFVHPPRAVYVFGPEDDSVNKGVRAVCHRFVRIPGNGCLNLAAAVNVVLAFRNMRQEMGYPEYVDNIEAGLQDPSWRTR